MAIHTIYLNGEFFNSGRIFVEEITAKLGVETNAILTDTVFDVFLIGGEPAGASAAIYTAHKVLKVGVIAKIMKG